MIRLVNHLDARRRIRKKQKIEVDFTHEIYDTFNQMPWIGEIQMAVKAGLGAMLEDESHYLNRAADDEKFLDVWTRHHASTDRAGVLKLYDLCGRMNPTRRYIDRFGTLLAVDCGDLMRLIGRWVELHPGSRMAFLKRFERFGDLQQGGPWDDVGRSATRSRENLHWTKNSATFGNQTFDWTPIDVRKELLRYGEDKHAHAGESCGRQIKRIPKECSDSTLKMDRLFGLRDICSISGTTADVMYFLRTFGPAAANDYRDLGLIYRMLPFGTIAGFHHHSVLEVALVQTLKDYIGYRVGQYTTLIPKGSNYSSALTRALWGIAWKYEQQLYDQQLHMICFYDEIFPEGAIVFEGIEEWERFFNSGVSDVRRLSEVAPSLPIGHMTLERTMSAIRSIDPAFWYWLISKLRSEQGAELDYAWTPPSVRRAERLAELRAA